MASEKAKKLFSMDGKSSKRFKEDSEVEDPETEENSRILEEWDRLTNVSEEGTESSSPPMIELSAKSKYDRRRSFSVSPNRILDRSAENSLVNSSLFSDTVQLPENLADLLAQAENLMNKGEKGPVDQDYRSPRKSNASNASNSTLQDATERLEVNLQSLLRHVAPQASLQTSEDDVQVTLDSSAATSASNEREMTLCSMISINVDGNDCILGEATANLDCFRSQLPFILSNISAK
jgi:hypothetical protein